MPLAEPALTVTDEEPGAFLFAQWKNLAIQLWSRGPDAASVTRLARLSEPFAEAHPHFSVLHIGTADVGMPDTEARGMFVELSRRQESQLGCVGVVLEAGGFRASAIRSVVTGIQMVQPAFVPAPRLR